MAKTVKQMESEVRWRLFEIGFSSALMLNSAIVAATSSNLWVVLLNVVAFGVLTSLLVASVFLFVLPRFGD